MYGLSQTIIVGELESIHGGVNLLWILRGQGKPHCPLVTLQLQLLGQVERDEGDVAAIIQQDIGRNSSDDNLLDVKEYRAGLMLAGIELRNLLKVVGVSVSEVVEQFVVRTITEGPITVLEPALLYSGITCFLLVGPTQTKTAAVIVTEEVGFGL